MSSSDRTKPLEAADLTKKKPLQKIIAMPIQFGQNFMDDPWHGTTELCRNSMKFGAFLLPDTARPMAYMIADMTGAYLHLLPQVFQHTLQDMLHNPLRRKKDVSEKTVEQTLCLPIPCDSVVPKPVSVSAPCVT